MSKQEKIEYIRERCIEANPSIKDLILGCEINITDIHFMCSKAITASQNPLKVLTVTSDPNVYLILTKIGIEHFKWRDIDLYCEIIGRPIRLADVLLAIEQEEFASGFTAHPDGELIFNDYLSDDGEDGSCSGDWNLIKDDLTLQPQETIDFLYSLLNKEE